MPKVYDDALKKLFRANAQDFVSLIQPGWQVEELLPTELDTEHIYADGLVRCRDENDQPQLAHFEYQRESDERMGERLLEYNIKASRTNKYLSVLSCVIYLKKGEDVPRSPFMQRLNNGRVTTIFYYVGIDLGETSVEELLAKGLPGLLPLLPLTDGGNQHEAIDIMIERLIEANKTDLLWVGYVLAAKVFSNDKDLQWLKGRFALMNDFLADSPIYQEVVGEAIARGEAQGLAKGMEKGIAQGMEKGIETGKMQALTQTRREASQGLLDLVSTRFPALQTLAGQCINKVSDNSALLHLLVRIGIAQTEEEARTELQSCLDA